MIAIITGASSGIGREFAYQVDDLGFEEIWLIARRVDRLKEVSKDLKTKSKVLNYDLLEDSSYEDFSKVLKENTPEISLLINSAGLGYNDYFENISLSDEDKLIDLNIKSPTRLIKIALPFMARPSTIINLGSVAGFLPQGKFASYAASKSYIISLSRALNRELRPKKIHVACLCPNPVDTEFSTNSEDSIKKFAKEDIKKLVKKALKKAGHRDLITTHPASKFILVISKILPHSFIMWVEKIIGLY